MHLMHVISCSFRVGIRQHDLHLRDSLALSLDSIRHQMELAIVSTGETDATVKSLLCKGLRDGLVDLFIRLASNGDLYTEEAVNHPFVEGSEADAEWDATFKEPTPGKSRSRSASSRSAPKRVALIFGETIKGLSQRIRCLSVIPVHALDPSRIAGDWPTGQGGPRAWYGVGRVVLC